ncbi:MAG: hypothetical protein K6B74_10045 [Ruminococcus sp.]|nr:hypothetical protein [Ruminococcus sp.]
MVHYKSWQGLKKQLEDRLCEPLKGRVTFFLTRYHKVHNAYGRAAVMLDGRELARFEWQEMYKQDSDLAQLYKSGVSYEDGEHLLKSEWDENCTYHETDFLAAALAYLNMPIDKALESDELIVRIFAILDSRVGKRTLQKIKDGGEYLALPGWVRQFYELRFEVSGIK